MCNSTEIVDGNIRIRWTFVHMGGQPLTDILVTYIFIEGQVSVVNQGPEVGVGDRVVDIPPLVVGFRYMALVNASNAIGSTIVECPAVNLEVGIPPTPLAPLVRELGEGSVVVVVRTLASGLEPGGVLNFILTQTLIATQTPSTKEHTMSIDNYRNGDNVEFRIDDLVTGGYTFAVRVMNRFGASGSTTSTVIQITGMYVFM